MPFKSFEEIKNENIQQKIYEKNKTLEYYKDIEDELTTYFNNNAKFYSSEYLVQEIKYKLPEIENKFFDLDILKKIIQDELEFLGYKYVKVQVVKVSKKTKIGYKSRTHKDGEYKQVIFYNYNESPK